MNCRLNAMRSFDVPHPGEFIREEMEARGWSQRYVAHMLGLSGQEVAELLSGERGVNPEIARALGDVFGVSAEYFANLQNAYEQKGEAS